jgi:enoyl-CoA hydratase/carnithine racemase
MTFPSHPHLETRQEGRIFWLTLNRPDKLNCMRDDMLQVFCEIVDKIEWDDSISVAIIHGAGRCFSTGYDISPEVDGQRPRYAEGSRQFFKKRYAFLDKVWNCPKPFIAAVHGYCLASGSDLANMCDITIASEDAEFGYPATRWGGHTHRLTYPWNMPLKKAKEAMFTGDRFSAAEAERMGMVNRVVPPGQHLEAAKEMAERICRIPLSGLVTNKISLNYSYETRGFTDAMKFSFQIAETNLWKDQDPFWDKAKAEGLNAALAWRDGQFEDKKK